jgi:hypothetical protein
MESDMIDVTVKVPEERLPEFYAMHAAWLNAPSPAPVAVRAQEETVQPTADMPGVDTDGRRPWLESDSALVAKLWEKFSDPAKALFSKLIDEPDRQFNGVELAEMLQIPNGHNGVAGVLAWPGKYCQKEGRKRLWEWKYPVDGEPVVYWVTPDVAELLRRARGDQTG